MTRSKKFANPFYGLLLVAGIAFAITATAYGVMAFRDRDTAASVTSPTAEDHPLMTWMSEYGNRALIGELVAMAVFTVGAIATDDYWQRCDKNQSLEHGARSGE
jgi:hypothetical protein